MNDVINRQAVLDEIDDTNRRGGFGCKLSYTRCRGHIEQLPSVNPQEPKTGHWDSRTCKCSECGYQITFSEYAERKYKYCPNCGAKMVEPQESEDKE